jgi:hypothetical protein
MQSLLTSLKKSFPEVSFEPGDLFSWSPKTKTVNYRLEKGEAPRQAWTLLHETAHAALYHQEYTLDVELLLMEVAAWQKAKELGRNFAITIDEDYIQDCLDTYRDWLHRRSTCPHCTTVSFQVSRTEYACHNCRARWSVTTSRFCRPYRSLTNKKPLAKI